MELLPEWAPNVHPLIVHFPIALVVGAVVVDLLSLVLRRWDWLRPGAVFLYVLGGASAVATYFTGTWAADTVSVPAQAQSVLTEHSNLGWWTMWFFGIYALVRLGAYLWPRARRRAVVQGALLLLALGGSYLLYETGDRGAEMVYRYGVGVQQTESKQAVAKPGLTVGESGWRWQPQSDTAWTGRMQWLEGSPDVVRARLDTLDDGSVALALTPQSPVTFVFPDTLGAVQVTAEVNLEDFQGTAALLYHVQDAENYDFLSVGEGAVRQGRTSGGDDTVMDNATVDHRGWLTVRAVGDGTHFRGYLGSELVTHPHGEARDPGIVGVRLDGTGTVRLRRLAAKSL